MKVRAVTYFISAQSFEELCERVDASVGFFRAAIGELRARGVDLQMVRIATNGCDQWADAAPALALEQLVQLDGRLGALEAEVGGGVSVIASLGQLDSRLEDGVLVAALSQTSRLFACVAMRVSTDGLPDLERAHACARLVLQLNDAARTTGGLVVEGPLAGAPFCFKLAVTARLGAGTPFFPGAYAPPPGESAERLAPAGSTWAAPAFAFACENSDLLVAAFARARKSADASGGCVLRAASAELAAEFGSLVGQLDALGAKLEAQCPGVAFAGTDSSVASAACPEHSLVAAFESLGVGRFGGAGTTAICALVTAVLRGLPYRLVGYCGLSARSARPPSMRAGCALRRAAHGAPPSPRSRLAVPSAAADGGHRAGRAGCARRPADQQPAAQLGRVRHGRRHGARAAQRHRRAARRALRRRGQHGRAAAQAALRARLAGQRRARGRARAPKLPLLRRLGGAAARPAGAARARPAAAAGAARGRWLRRRCGARSRARRRRAWERRALGG